MAGGNETGMYTERRMVVRACVQSQDILRHSPREILRHWVHGDPCKSESDRPKVRVDAQGFIGRY